MAALEINGLSKAFGGVIALGGVDLSIPDDRITGIVGPNGSGKTTLFNVITGVYPPTGGSITWHGEDISGRAPHQIARKGLVRTFQQAMSFPGLSVKENIQIALERGSRQLRGQAPRWHTPEDLLDFVGLGGRGGDDAGSMPFGNLRRLGVAVALAANPVLLLLDEPAAGLSDGEANMLADLIMKLPEMGIGVCLIDHHMTFMTALCQRLIVLDFGTKIADGTTQSVLTDPKVMEVYLGGEL
ncbi:MAG: ABC transporter ATP-binding protein [Ancalomicrobiaceae bacterium]|nr:ABC transporter ATP-binding protein [Ancalomicrobiaceae bacterium]